MRPLQLAIMAEYKCLCEFTKRGAACVVRQVTHAVHHVPV